MAVHKHTPRRHAHRACQRCGKAIPPVARKYADPFGTAARSAPGRLVIGGLRIRTA